MKNFYKIGLLLAIIFCHSANVFAQKSSKYKCMVQMTNYIGEGAYVAVSLIDSKGVYDKTLYILGEEKKWYPDIKEWNKFYKKKPNVSAVTGASVNGGDRSVFVVDIEDSKIDAGYTIRFESAVENQEYYIKDLEIPLTTANVSGKTDGTGFIRYVRLSPN